MSNSPTEFEWLILELMKKLKDDMHDFRNQIDKRIDRMQADIDKRFADMDRKFEQTQDEQRWMQEKILEIWEHRKELTVKSSRNWAWQNLIFSGGIFVITVVIAFLFFGK